MYFNVDRITKLQWRLVALLSVCMLELAGVLTKITSRLASKAISFLDAYKWCAVFSFGNIEYASENALTSESQNIKYKIFLSFER